MSGKVFVSSLVCALLSTGCFSTTRESSSSPSEAAQVLGGQWATTQSLPGAGSGSIKDACTDFKWSVTEFSGSSASGTFSATCAAVLQITGSARGTLSGTTLNWTANATATGQGAQGGCPIALSGTAALEDGGRIRIPYSGTTCLGPVSGTEWIGKR
jgi:hypothetical protein